jgi:FMN phosphatase YigB (HAD superfamily)
MEEQAEYFANLFTGNQESIEEALWGRMDRYIALTALRLHIQDADDPEAEVEAWLDAWEKRVRSGLGEEVTQLQDMQDTPAGKMFGGLAPDPDDLTEGADEAIQSIRAEVKSALLD